MKRLTIIAAILLTGAASVARADDTDTLLGAAAGAAVGSTIGKGDGKTLAMVLGGLIGAGIAKDAAGASYGYGHPLDSRRIERSFRYECEHSIPRAYWGYADAQRAWFDGCMERKRMLMLEVQQQAYEDGLNGRR